MNSWCCKMRAKYLLGIVAENGALPTPVDVVDYLDLDERGPDGTPVLRIKYCPFCGKGIEGPLRVAE